MLVVAPVAGSCYRAGWVVSMLGYWCDVLLVLLLVSIVLVAMAYVPVGEERVWGW